MRKKTSNPPSSAEDKSVESLQSAAYVIENEMTGAYEALLLIGRANAKQYLNLVKKCLFNTNDPMLSRLALQVLCRYWGMFNEFMDEVKFFILKADWDEDDDVRLMAIDCAGSHLSTHKNIELIKILLDIFNAEDERQIVREAAYCALALAAGEKIQNLPANSRHFDLVRDINPSVINWAHDVLRDQKAKQ